MTSMPLSPASAENFFWSAIEIAAGGHVDTDIADVGRYVASRGGSAVAEFEAELTKAVTALRDAGLTDVLRRETTTPDGTAFADLSETDQNHGLERFLLAGRHHFEMLLESPEKEGGPFILSSVDLRQSVETARAEPGVDAVPLWQEMPGDRRPDGKLWLQVDLVLGGLDWADRWTIPGFLERFQKAALLRSLDDSWRAWRSSIEALTVSVSVQYWEPSDHEERVVVNKPGANTEVTVYRDFSRLSEPGGLLHIAELEADTVLREVRAGCTGCSDAPPTGRTSVGEETSGDEDWELPPPAPAFAAHFTDPLYEDDGLETAPFGSDEGFDMLLNWDERRDELGPDSTVADVLEGDPEEYLSYHEVDSAVAVQSAGFALLRLTGHIDDAGKGAVLAALEQLLGDDMMGEDPALIRQRDDLLSWPE